MEIDIEKEQERIKAEIASLNSQIMKIDQQLNNWNDQKNRATMLLLKKSGASELLQRFATERQAEKEAKKE